jgi:hypothetical protein
MSVAAPPAPAPDADESAAGVGESVAPDSSPNDRTYHVLEQRRLHELVLELLSDEESPITFSRLHDLLEPYEIYEPITVTVARNAEGAMRNAAKQLSGRSGDVVLLPVSERSWHPEIVTIRVEQIVTVGRAED